MKDDLIGLVECRKCGKTYSHPHKCVPAESEIEELRNMAFGLSRLAHAQNKQIVAMEKVLAKVKYFMGKGNFTMKATEEADWVIQRYHDKDWDLL